MKVKECMSKDVETVSPDDTIQAAARKMGQRDFGSLPVANDDRLVGMVTDRDIAIRAIGEGRGPETTVSEVMTGEILYCMADAEIDDALANMSDIQVRRLPVVDDSKALVGILSISDAAGLKISEAGETLAEIAQPSQQHSQAL